jgi:hypothetical protein
VGTFLTTVKAGDKFRTNEGYEIEVLEYQSYDKVKVRFTEEDNCVKYFTLKNILRGSPKNPYHPVVRGKGFIGEGPHKSKVRGNSSKTTAEYVHWSSMMTRSYYEEYHRRFPTYIGCSVEEQWYNFQEFGEWCQWQPGFNMGYVLDKDIILQGNKVYGPETCVFIPPELNSIIVTQVKPGKTVPAGISFQNGCQKYIVSCAIDGKNKNLGRFACPDEAFKVYKSFKEDLVKERAEKYKDTLDVRAYQAFMNFTVPEMAL